tara:strand:- start:2174 stop:2809 length:636 start_codon:yes stop_codon:yes gene_type:complete
MTENLLSFALATVALAFSPGPDNIYVLTQSLVNGVKSGLATTAGLVTGCIVHTTFLAFGLSAVITTSPTLFYGIKVLGALYLLYLAYVVFKNDATIVVPVTSEGKNNRIPTKTNAQLFKQGVIMNLVNPKVMIFFLAFFPAFLWNETENTVSQFYILGIVFMVISFLVFGLIAVLAGSISSYIVKHKSVGVILKWLQIVVFIGIAVFILIP